VIILALLLSFNIAAFTPDWSEGATLKDKKARADIYELGDDLEETKKRGYIHALRWPVSVTGLLVPHDPLQYFLEGEKTGLHRLIEKIAKKQLGFESMDSMYNWLGLNDYPDNDRVPSIFYVPYPDGVFPDYKMGASLQRHGNSRGLTFACTTCHSGTFLGRSVMGLTNKRARANEFFVMAKKYVPLVPAGLFRVATKASKEEKEMFARTRENLRFVDAVAPLVLGLDTSLPHVALSLNVRAKDAYASKVKQNVVKRHPLHRERGDSKSMPWWNLKYKTRWLSDGSIVQGNPVLTNFLWNELGRGTDLHELEGWMKNNTQTIDDLTATVFATSAPHWFDFFPESSLSLEKAQRGEVLFERSCMKCHGQYIKGWSLQGSESLTKRDQFKTIDVRYHEKTPVKNVGTDPARYLATKYFAKDLNRLAISKWMKTIVKPQVGYVPPPLEGIFLRYPYFHNNAIPSLCALMMKPENRPKVFVQGPSKGLSDYDQDCVGYPVGENIPLAWWEEKGAVYRANSRQGLSNQGHSRMFWYRDGSSKFSQVERRELIEYLKTL
jgi:hypothetical protein